MRSKMIITFVGHRKMLICEELRNRIISTIKANLTVDNNIFYCGGYGAFDTACARIVKQLKSETPSIESVFVTPYLNDRHLHDNEIYDSILYPPIESVPYRFAISKRNEYMINNSDVIIAYVSNDLGGACKTLMYAKRKNKKIINLADKYV